MRFRREILVSLVLVAAVLIGFGPVLTDGFLLLDDLFYVSENSSVLGGLNRQNVVWAFTTFRMCNWQPLAWLSLQADATFFREGPWGFHFTNLALHAASAVVLFLAWRMLTGALWPSAFVGALFAVHPLRVESVAWISERKDVLCGFFSMLTLLAYAAYVRRPGLGRYMSVVLAFVCALLAKPMAVTLPCLLLFVDYWPLNRVTVNEPESGLRESALSRWQFACRRGAACWRAWWPLLREKLPLFALTAVFSVVTMYAQDPAIASPDALPLTRRGAGMLVAYASYIHKTVWPVNLAAMYLIPKRGLPLWQPVASADFLGLVTLLVLKLRRRRYLVVGWLWFLGTLVPTIGLVQVGQQFMADRYTYLPSIGLFVMGVWGVAELAARWRMQELVGWAACGLLAVCLVLTWGQAHYWNDDITLWEHALEATGPENNYARNALGVALWKQAETEKAKQQFREALRVNSSDAPVCNSVALICLEEGDVDEAVRILSVIAAASPRTADYQNNLGVALFEQGHASEAIPHFERVLRLDPRNPTAHHNLGLALVKDGRPGQAVDCLQRAVELQPGEWPFRSSLAFALNRLQQPEPAAAQYREATRLNPSWLQDYNVLARVRSSSLDPRRRKGIRAVQYAEQVCDATGWQDPNFLDTLAIALAETGRFDEAVRTARQALNRAEASQNSQLVQEIQGRIRLYEGRKPYRSPS